MEKIDPNKIPEFVSRVTTTLEKGGFEAYLVGGCVRDLLTSKEPKDWDVATNAKPEEIQALFEKTVYENKFGTVGVLVARETLSDVSREIKGAVSYETIEVTTYRKDGKYSDNRHPEEVTYSETIEEDLKRRDFTMNSIALAIKDIGGIKDISIKDNYNGIKDINDRLIRTTGHPDERFQEDALRMLRAVRFSAQLGFAIDGETLASISKNADLLKNISAERIRDEFIKIIMSKDPMLGVGLLVRLGLNKYIIPELEEGIKCEQLGEHVYDVFEHILHALGHSANKNTPLDIRLSALFHDIGKPRTRRWDGTKAGGKGKFTFYGHEVVGARMVSKIMERLKFPKDLTDKVVKMVRYHMFFSDPDLITLSAVRRTIVNVGRENIWDLMQVRECDRVGMKKKEAPLRLRKYHTMIEEALRAPTSVGMLKINGDYMIKEMKMPAGRKMGWILHALLAECLEDDSKNNLEYLEKRTLELCKLSDTELMALGEKGKIVKEKTEEEELNEIKKKYNV
jgi:putative nucleotidyltransferase with HDIG domain